MNESGAASRWSSRKWWVGGAILAVAWAAIALAIVPALIRSAWAGESLAFLNALIEGSDVHPASYYIDLWNRIARLVTVALLATTAALALVYPFRRKFAGLLRDTVRRPPTVGWGGLLILGAAFGIVTGLAEAVPALVRATVALDPDAPPIETIWMAPLAAAMAGIATASMMALILRAGRRVSIRLVLFLYGTVVVYTMLASLSIGLHHFAILVLALGSARVFSTLAVRAHEPFLRVSRYATAAAVTACLALGLGMVGSERLAERGALAVEGVAPAGTPNVLFLILDTVRARSLSLYGYERPTTPELERWMAQGTVFDNAIATTSWTLPSHASMFTGRSPDELSTDFDRSLDDTYPTLAEELGRHGYATGGFVANLLYTTRRSGLDRGFAHYEDNPRSLPAFLASSRWIRTPVEWFRKATGKHGMLVRKDARHVNTQFINWLDHVGDRPFFAFLNYFDAHSPYETKAPFDVKFRSTPPRYWLMKGWSRGYSAEELQEFTDAYDAAIAYIDHEIGSLLDELERRGVLDNTILVVVADHGESLGEHDILIHANALYREQIHVPLAIRFPGRVPAGVRIADAVSLASLPATTLDLAGFDVTFDGESMARYWSGNTHGQPTDGRVAYSELTYNRFAHPRDPIQRGLMRSIVRGDWHFILNGDGVEELYAYRSDPAEEFDLADHDDTAPALVFMREALQAHLAGGARDPAGTR